MTRSVGGHPHYISGVHFVKSCSFARSFVDWLAHRRSVSSVYGCV